MHCTLTRKEVVVNIVVVHASASADDAPRHLRSQWVANIVTALGAEARVLIVGDWILEPRECDTLVAAHTLGFRAATPACPTRWEGSRCIDWAIFRFKYYTVKAT
eukprot:15000829-Alexandrium_andersonii.AAC.1